jgi:hypothetical protein
LRSSAAPLAALSERFETREYGARAACVNRGFCHQGCRNGAKGSMDATYLVWAVRSGAEIRPHAFVYGFERGADGALTAALYRDTSEVASGGQRERPGRPQLHGPRRHGEPGVEQEARRLDAARGKNEAARADAALPHVATQVWGTFAEPVRMNKGFPATIISEDTLHPDTSRTRSDFAGGYLTQSLGVVPVTFAETVTRGRGLWGKRLVDYLDRYDFLAGIGINGDCLPAAGNRLVLTDERDEHGVPSARIDFSYGPNERAMSDHAARLLADAWEAAGAKDTWVAPRTAHTLGTCRMGTSPERSVVDPWGRAHDVPNLWICDNSVFPSALAANPALTIMALSSRTADRMLGRS